jgi:dolichol-phosphate mannosyltransferase
MSEIKTLSIIISIYNEEGNIKPVLNELFHEITKINNINFEIICVNDGSKDSSLKVLNEIQTTHPIKIINFTRNFGHEIAMTAGMNYAKGDAVLFMDGDGQNPTSTVVKMIHKWLEGFDIVLSKRTEYKQSAIKTLLSKTFYKILNFLSDIKFDSSYPDFRLISRKYIERIKKINETERMFRGILNWIGITNHTIIEFTVPPRISGKSNYNMLKYLNLGINGILQFSIKPLRIFTIFAIICCILSIFYAGYIFFDHIIYHRPQSGFATIVLLMISFFSIQTLIISLIGEYVGRIHIEVKKRPLYFADITEITNSTKNYGYNPTDS